MSNSTLSDSTVFGVRLTFAKWVAASAFTVAGIGGLAVDRYSLSESLEAAHDKIRALEAVDRQTQEELRALQDWKIREEARDGKA